MKRRISIFNWNLRERLERFSLWKILFVIKWWINLRLQTIRYRRFHFPPLECAPPPLVSSCISNELELKWNYCFSELFSNTLIVWNSSSRLTTTYRRESSESNKVVKTFIISPAERKTFSWACRCCWIFPVLNSFARTNNLPTANSRQQTRVVWSGFASAVREILRLLGCHFTHSSGSLLSMTSENAFLPSLLLKEEPKASWVHNFTFSSEERKCSFVLLYLILEQVYQSSVVVECLMKSKKIEK